MKVVLMTTVPWSLDFFRGQVGDLERRGFEVHAISSPGDELQKFSARERIPVHAVPMTRKISPVQDLVSLARLWWRLRALRPTIVHSHTPKAGLLGMIAGWLARTPVRIYHIHGLPLVTAGRLKRALLKRIEWVACRLAHEVICVSHSVRAVAIEHGLCPPEKIRVLLGGSVNGIDASGRFDPARAGPEVRRAKRAELGIPVDAPVVGFVGRIVRDKGLVELTAAWRALREVNPSLHLLIVGPFEEGDPVPPDIVKTLQSDPRVHLTGATGDVVGCYAAMDVFALPSHREGLSSVLLEAGAMELPAVASNVPGCHDVVKDGATGKLVPVGDPVALASAIQSYVDRPALRREHGRAARELVMREFRQEAVWDAIATEYRRLAAERGVAWEAEAAPLVGASQSS